MTNIRGRDGLDVRWSRQLQLAAIALRDDTTPHKYPQYHESLDADIRSRAAEYARLTVGTRFSGAQVEYTICLLQRLDMEYDNPRATHTAFKAAWAEALEE